MLAVMPPMLPHLVREFSLSAAAAGVLTASYSAGMLVATVPAGMAESRFGARMAARLGLGVLALGSLGFAVATTPASLAAWRFVSALGGACAWAGALGWVAQRAPSHERGAAFGGVIGAAFAGTLAAPACALIANHAGRILIFVPLAFAFAAVAAWGGPSDMRSERSRLTTGRMLAVLQHRDVALPLVEMILIGVVLGTMMSVAPLLLAARGIETSTIALLFFAVYAPQLAISPAIGRAADRLGAQTVLTALLFLTAALLPVVGALTAPAALGFAFVVLYSVVLTAIGPVSVWISRATEANAGSQGFAVALTNGAWGVGSTVGAVALSLVAEEVSFEFALCLAGFVAAGAAVLAGRRARSRVGSGRPGSTPISER